MKFLDEVFASDSMLEKDEFIRNVFKKQPWILDTNQVR